jgi:pyruvate,orthophosphate dikinase
MNDNDEKRALTALEINLERTRSVVEIPDRYGELRAVAASHVMAGKRTEEMLQELHHPFVNQQYLLEQLRGLSTGDFNYFNSHEGGLPALQSFANIYLDVISLPGVSEETKDCAVRYCLEYLDTILTKSGQFLERNTPLISVMFNRLADFSPQYDRFFKKSSGYARALVKSILEKGEIDADNRITANLKDAAVRILLFSLKATYRYWLEQPDPVHWFLPEGETAEAIAAYRDLIEPLSHERLGGIVARLDEAVQGDEGNEEKIQAFLDFPDHARIANGYLDIADALEKSEAFAGRCYLSKLDFLFKMMGVAGLADQRNAIFIDIDRCLIRALKEENNGDVKGFIHKIFTLFKKTIAHDQYKGATLDSISILAKEIFSLNNHTLVDDFIEELVAFGFQHPELKGATAEWQIQVNPAHIKNIRSWLAIIALKPRWTKKLLSALIINLKVGGVFVSDADLLQKDISGLLNADILPAYNKLKQLLRIFPVYFREIGAEGELRTISTAVDELSARNDRLVYFVRKQSHVESNSLLVPFIENIFRYWQSGDRTILKGHLPEEVYREINPSGEYFSELHIIFNKLLAKIHGEAASLLTWDSQQIEKEINTIVGVSDREKKRAELMIRLYQLLHRKYFHQNADILKELENHPFLNIEKTSALKRSLERKDCYRSLWLVLDMLAILKDMILAPQKTEYFEDIYYKRHIAAGIPSMYGTYREKKFEAMGLTFRLESFATVLFERLSESLSLKFITKSTLIKIHKYLWLYIKALELEGVATEGLVGKLRLITNALQIRQFTIDQYFDIFHFIARGIQDIARDNYIDVHRSNLAVIIGQLAAAGHGDGEDIAEPDDRGKFYQAAESFARSIISSAFGMQPLDCLVNRIIGSLSGELEKFKDNRKILNQVMSYTPELAISSLYVKSKRVDNQIMIGNKAYLLKELISLRIPVPPGFVITTEVFRGYEGVMGHKSTYKDLKLKIYKEIRELERITGKTFGNPENPLLFSVRSGATISLPGMMRSFLNVGINEKIAEGLARKEGYQWAAWDSYRRFLQTWGMFQGLERNIFDEIINSYKVSHMVAKKFQFEPEQMKQLALSYKDAILQRGIKIPENPYQQLHQAVIDVFASWNSEQARIYRHQARLSDEWGTAVMVQAMVFGNLHENSGSGVIFTRDPKGASQDVSINGDFIFCVQGDDIVSGLVETFPVSEKQRIAEKREAAISLETSFPKIYRELVKIAELLIYGKGFNHQEIEFTFEDATESGLYILQTRDMVQRENGHTRIFSGSSELEQSFLGAGIGVSGGALTGRAVYNEDEIQCFRDSDRETALILIRPDTVPDDVGIILKADGILTARGGGTSHAAVTIPQLKKVGVVGFSKLRVYEAEGYSKVDGTTIRGGDFISIDGWTGAVYMGKHPTKAVL